MCLSCASIGPMGNSVPLEWRMSLDYWFWKFFPVLVLIIIVGIFIVPKLTGQQAEQFLSHVRRRTRELPAVYLLLALLGLVAYWYYRYMRLR